MTTGPHAQRGCSLQKYRFLSLETTHIMTGKCNLAYTDLQLLLIGRAQFGATGVGRKSSCHQAEQSFGSTPEKPAHPVSIFGFCHLCIADDAPLATLAALDPGQHLLQ